MQEDKECVLARKAALHVQLQLRNWARAMCFALCTCPVAPPACCRQHTCPRPEQPKRPEQSKPCLPGVYAHWVVLQALSPWQQSSRHHGCTPAPAGLNHTVQLKRMLLLACHDAGLCAAAQDSCASYYTSCLCTPCPTHLSVLLHPLGQRGSTCLGRPSAGCLSCCCTTAAATGRVCSNLGGLCWPCPAIT